MRRFVCPKCGRTGDVGDFPRVRCSCGLVCDGDCFEANTCEHSQPAKAHPKLPCVHRGESLRVVDCACMGDTTVYRCGIHGECMIRRLKPASGPDATCNVCEQRDSPANYAAILTTHFNPARRERLRETWRQWDQWIEHPYQCLELVFGDAEPEIHGSVVHRGADRNLLWQKERLINLGLAALPDSVRYVAWIDHDLILTAPDWLEASIAMLDSGFDAVQLFDRVTYWDRDRKPIHSVAGAGAVLAAGGKPSNAPGGAWIASRAWLDRIGGIYDRNVVGGGDAVFFGAVTGTPTAFLERQPEGVRADAQRWLASVGRCRWGYLRGAACHIWHGDRANRQYHARDAMLCEYGFDPAAHLCKSQNGLLELSRAAPAGLAVAIARYFADRRDDG